MAIDVEKEAIAILNSVSRNVAARGPGHLIQDIIDLVTRAVAEAKLKQMERDVDAVLFHCCDDRPEMCGPHHYVQSIRTAFAATQSQDTAAAQQQSPDKHRVMAIVLAEIARLRDQYPTDVFGYGTAPDASPDSQSARMARLTCDNLEREIKAALRDAATEPRDIGKDDARKRFDQAAVGIARNWHEQFGDKKNGPACCCGGCKLIAAAREAEERDE